MVYSAFACVAQLFCEAGQMSPWGKLGALPGLHGFLPTPVAPTRRFDLAVATSGNFGKNMAVNAATDGRDRVASFFWRLARAAPCCPAARNSMKTW